jgi:hypothetical protein
MKAGRYTLIGGLWIEAERRSDYKSKIKRLREEHDVHGEFKWNRVSPSRQLFYMELIDFFFEEPIRFRCVVLPAEQLDVVRFHDGDNELMFYKFYYQLLHHWIYDFNTYRVFVDLKTNRVKQRLAKLCEVLDKSNYFAKVNSVQALPSHEVDLLQLVDVLIGAVGYHFNGGGTSAAKLALVQSISQHLNHSIQPTRKAEEKFNIFRWQPGGGW